MKDKQTIINERWKQIIQSKTQLFGNHTDWINRYQLLIEKIRNRYPFNLLYPLTSHYHLRFSFDENLHEYWHVDIFINPSFKTEKGLFEVGIDEDRVVYFNDVEKAIDEFARTLLRQPTYKITKSEEIEIVDANSIFTLLNCKIVNKAISDVKVEFIGGNFQKYVLHFLIKNADDLIKHLNQLEFQLISVEKENNKLQFWLDACLIGEYKVEYYTEYITDYNSKDWIKLYEQLEKSNKNSYQDLRTTRHHSYLKSNFIDDLKKLITQETKNAKKQNDFITSQQGHRKESNKRKIQFGQRLLRLIQQNEQKWK